MIATLASVLAVGCVNSNSLMMAFAAGNAADSGTEVTWSVMHPTELDPAYMARVVEKAVEYGGVDSFEVCGTCHSGMGGMDGLLLFEPYRNTF